MSYVTYTTDALVCGTYDRNTTDRSYRLFTRELGMLYADARSVRKESSRQRHALQDFSYIRISLVKGKGGWKIGSVTERCNYYGQAVNKPARGSVVRITRLIRRFVTGEEMHQSLFDECILALDFFSRERSERKCYEHIFTQRVLAVLGYIKATDVPAAFATARLDALPSADICAYDKAIALSIERAQHASQL